MADGMLDREANDLTIRRTTRADVDAAVALLARTMGEAGDQRDRDFYIWKHYENPFGESPSWAAFDGDRMVAVRTLMRWDLVKNAERLRMVRAVDTATDPDYQGRGLFRRLTMRAVEELSAEGFDAVFNTPNHQSQPGYLKMGWSVLGRPTIWVSPRSPVSLLRMVRARTGAEKWSEPISGSNEDLRYHTLPESSGWATDRSREYLKWRYGFEPLRYSRVDVDGGVAWVRLRRRGLLRELVIADWLSESADAHAVRRLLRESGADYALGLGCSVRSGFIPLPRQGPTVTWKPLARAESMSLRDVSFALGDLELF